MQGRAKFFLICVGGLLIAAVSASGFLFSLSSELQRDFYVAPDGSDLASGKQIAPLATLNEAVKRMQAVIKTNSGSVPAGGLTVWVKGGLYTYTTTLTLGASFQGTERALIVIRAVPGETPVFDGSISLDASSFQLVTNAAMLARLNPNARGHVLAATVTNSVVTNFLSKRTNLNLDGKMMRKSRFPNEGYAHIKQILDNGAVYMAGRTLGDPPAYSWEAPIGGEFILTEQPGGDWAAEADEQNATVTGYLAYDWYKETHSIARVTNGCIKLLDYSSYGVISTASVPRRLAVYGLLCELDVPGEWFFDKTTQTLFIYPFTELTSESSIGVWAGGLFADFNQCAYVTLRDLTITGAANLSDPAMVRMIGGHHNRLAGCTLKNSERLAIKIEGGQFNGIQSCDVYDVVSHIRTDGGAVKTLTPTSNYVDNCHFTQVQAGDYYGGVAIRGVGDRLSHSLIHNLPGQPITPSGNLQSIEDNEVFNVGFEEGDGGAMYTAQAVWGGYGQVFRGNFLHHVVCTPQLHPRGGIYFDQQYGGGRIENNVFYKCAQRTILINGGAGVTVSSNLFLNGYYGFYNTDVYARDFYANFPKYDSGELKRGDVNDYLWRTEQAVGTNGWNREPWASAYPQFARIMNNYATCFYPVENVLRDNYFGGNVQNIVFRHGTNSVATDLYNDATTNWLDVQGVHAVELTQFKNAGSLNFSASVAGMPDFSTAAAGLVTDEFRQTVPDKNGYRTAVRTHFQSIPSYDPSAIYNPDEIKARRLNSGKMLFFAAGLVETFDTFIPGTLTAQQNWAANAGAAVVATTTSGFYTAGRALLTTNSTDKTLTGTNLTFGLEGGETGIEYGFDYNTTNTTLVSTKMRLAIINSTGVESVPSPSFGLTNGWVNIRVAGEAGTDFITGNNLAGSTYYNATPASGQWAKGDWIHFSLQLTGAVGSKFTNATITAYNMTRGWSIATGVTDVNLSGYTTFNTTNAFNAIRIRNSTGGVFLDNVYVKAP